MFHQHLQAIFHLPVLSQVNSAITAYDSFLSPLLVGLHSNFYKQLFYSRASQLWQVARQMTTLEVTNLSRYGFMGGRAGASLSGQMGHRHDSILSGVDTDDASLVGNDASSSNSSTGAVHRHSGICSGCGGGFLMNLLGFDQLQKGKL